MKIFAKDNFKVERMKRGFSLRALRKASGVEATTICRLEGGGSVFPTTAKRLCEALCVEFDEIFEIREAK